LLGRWQTILLPFQIALEILKIHPIDNSTMAAHMTNEKDESSVGQLHIPSPSLSNKASDETLDVHTTHHLPNEKGLESRPSDVSAPSTVHLANPFDTDVEAIITPNSERCGRKSGAYKGNDCQMWPTNDHWRQKAKAAKVKRSCTCLAHLSKRNRLLVKILIGILIVGIAVAIGVGISKPLGAGIWQPHQGNGPQR
jgi:hypothetical protein